MKDKAYVDEINAKANFMLDEYGKKAEEIFAEVKNKLDV